MDSVNNVGGALYMCSLVLFGSFFLVNLFLAVIMKSFDENRSSPG
jgi:hypothetical protein